MKEPKFTNSWFQDGAREAWDRHLVPLAPFRRYLEIGTCEGASMHYALTRLLQPGGVAVAIDPYIPKRPKLTAAVQAQRERMRENLQPWLAGMDSSIPLLVWYNHPSRAVLTNWLTGGGHGGEFDLVLVDGDHSARAAILDLLLVWDFVQPGGVIVLDDIDRRWYRGRPLVWEAMLAFELTHGNKLDVLFQTRKQKAWRKKG